MAHMTYYPRPTHGTHDLPTDDTHYIPIDDTLMNAIPEPYFMVPIYFSLLCLTLSTLLVLLFQGVSFASWVIILHKFLVNGKVVEGSMRDIEEATGNC